MKNIQNRWVGGIKKLRENCGGETLKFKIEKIKNEKNKT